MPGKPNVNFSYPFKDDGHDEARILKAAAKRKRKNSVRNINDLRSEAGRKA